MIILKLGGSLLTHKDAKFSMREGVLQRVAAEIKAAREPLVIVHGGGSYGHPVAGEYDLHEGYKDPSQIRGVALTRRAMSEFNRAVMEALINAGLNAVSLQTSALALCHGGELMTFNIEALEGFLNLGLTPVLYGDVVLDAKQGFCILSGDRIVSHLSRHLKPSRIILAIDRDGIFDRDPGHKDAALVEEVNEDNYKRVLASLGSPKGDVTGGLKGKLVELLLLAKDSRESLIVNGLVPGRLSKALLGEGVKGTKIKRGNYDDRL
jgi:isopentenyl phosphate kinase